MTLGLQGCETMRGAGSGLKKDIENFKGKNNVIYKIDGWLRDHLW